MSIAQKIENLIDAKVGLKEATANDECIKDEQAFVELCKKSVDVELNLVVSKACKELVGKLSEILKS